MEEPRNYKNYWIRNLTVFGLLIIALGFGAVARVNSLSTLNLSATANISEPGSQQETAAYQGDDPYAANQRRAIEILSAHEEVAQHLDAYPGWSADAWQNEDDPALWNVNLVVLSVETGEQEDWLGEGKVNLETGEIVEYYVPRELTPDEFQTGLQKVEALVASDPEVQAVLGNPGFWEHTTYYERWGQHWETSFWYGLDSIVVRTSFNDDGVPSIEQIYDPNEMDEAEADLQRRNQAIELAYESDGIDLALDNVDNWRTYVEDQSDDDNVSRFSVEFVSDGEMLFYALVDIDAWTIIESGE